MSVGTSLNQRLLIVWLFGLAFLCGLMVLLGQTNLPVPSAGRVVADNRESSRQETPAHSGEARQSTTAATRKGDSRGGQSFPIVELVTERGTQR